MLPLPVAPVNLKRTQYPMATRRLLGRADLNVVAPLRRAFAIPVVKNEVKTESTILVQGLDKKTAHGIFLLLHPET